MVSRVSTAGSYSAVLANLMAAKSRQDQANNQVSTEKNGQNLKDYSKDAEILSAMRSVQSRVTVYQDQNSVIADKLSSQDAAMNQITDAARQARQAISDALASDSSAALVAEMQAQFTNAAEGLNTRHGGKYLFAGGQIDTEPMTAPNMAALTTPATTVADFFKNDDFKVQAKLDDATTVTTGVLASDVGTDVMTNFKAMQNFFDTTTPLGGSLTAAQRSFLESQLASWDATGDDLTLQTARNGLVQNRVDDVKGRLDDREASLNGMVGDITNVNMAEAVSRLEQSQLALQAAAQVFATLQNTSLLNLLK
ncbi:MAG: flagellin [Caulobacteraceae bacterium]|nr:flagellin [Caulobacteraceae bacterium]